MQIVISRFNENIQWSDSLSDVILYNKGEGLTSSHPVIHLKNVGREEHTFAYHIFTNYDTLAEYTCFLQGNPFAHEPNLLEKINTTPLEKFTLLSKHILLCDPTTKHYYHGPVDEVYQKLFEKPITDPWKFSPGAQMIVHKDIIYRYPKEIYEKIVHLLDHSSHPGEGFAIERLWGKMFEL